MDRITTGNTHFSVGKVLEHKLSLQEKPKAKVKRWCGAVPNVCQLCDSTLEDVFYDARTQSGRWGILCQMCFNEVGTGLGTGKGQKYDHKTLEKLGG